MLFSSRMISSWFFTLSFIFQYQQFTFRNTRKIPTRRTTISRTAKSVLPGLPDEANTHAGTNASVIKMLIFFIIQIRYLNFSAKIFSKLFIWVYIPNFIKALPSRCTNLTHSLYFLILLRLLFSPLNIADLQI